MTLCFRCAMPTRTNRQGSTGTLCDQCIAEIREQEQTPPRQFDPGCERDEAERTTPAAITTN